MSNDMGWKINVCDTTVLFHCLAPLYDDTSQYLPKNSPLFL